MGFIRGLFKTLIVLLLLIIIGGLLLPASTTVTRSIDIDAAPGKVYSLLNGFQHFNRFSPWYDKDPETEYTYSGPATGVGARMAWVSDNPSVGTGSNQIIAVEKNRRVTTRLDFGAQGSATGWFELLPDGDATEVTWGMRSDAGFDLSARYFNLMLDYFVGPDFEQGLRQLKILAEATLDDDTSNAVQDVVLERRPVSNQLLLKGESGSTPDAIGAALTQAFSRLEAAARAGGVNIAGAPRVISDSWSRAGYRFTAGLNVDGVIQDELPSGIRLQQQPEQSLACAVSASADQLPQTYQLLIHWIRDNGYLVAAGSREQSDNDGRTQVCFPVVNGTG